MGLYFSESCILKNPCYHCYHWVLWNDNPYYMLLPLIAYITNIVWDLLLLPLCRALSSCRSFINRRYSLIIHNSSLTTHNSSLIVHNSSLLTPLLLIFLSGCYKEQVLPVKTDFFIEIIDNNYSVPVKVKITDKTTGAETYQWTFGEASPNSSAAKDPGTIQYNTAGTYVIRLEAVNQSGGKDSHEISINLDPPLLVNFTFANEKSWFPEATIAITNTTAGGNTYQWIFEGGNPASSSQQQPDRVVFTTPGEHKISLTAGNGRISAVKEATITVLPDIVNHFQISWAAVDNDMEVPFTVLTKNDCISAVNFNWSFPDAEPLSSTDTAPTATYLSAGTYTIALTASNDKKSVMLSKTITLLPNSNLLKFSDVKLGINTAQNTIGCYFSSTLGIVLKSSEATGSNGPLIDFAFFGLDHTFNYNLFLSPAHVQEYTFSSIPHAIESQLINKQESCACNSAMTSEQFDAMSNDALFHSLAITQTPAGLAHFDKTVLPRVVLFKTADGRKGAIKLKEYKAEGTQSYMMCDVKVTKRL